MKRTTRAFLIALLLLCLIAGAVWRWTSPPPPPDFGVGSRTITPTTAPSFAIGQNFAAMVVPDSSLWAWGDVTTGSANLRFGAVPRRISRETGWKHVAAGFFGLIALKQDGSLWALGSNQEGLLGIDGITNSVPMLTRVGSDTDWKEIKTGVSHCIALKNDGSLWTWGQNHYGQIGVGFLSPREPITRIGFDTNWIAISPGAFQSYALRRDGTIWAWGLDFVTSKKNTIPTQIGTETNWTAISAGDYHLVATDADATSWVIGPNTMYIEPGAPNPTTHWMRVSAAMNWTQIQSGENCLLARDRDRTWHAVGQMGEIDLSKSWKFKKDFDPLAVHIQRSTILFLMRDGRLWSMGRRTTGESRPNALQKLRNTIQAFLTKTTSGRSNNETDYDPHFLWEQ